MLIRVTRFPRTDDGEMLYLAKMRAKYPAPPYNPRTDGSWNPADGIFEWLCKQQKQHLRKLCERHALESTGSRKRLIKRMYLHWRAAKLGLGKEWIGYGKGYENTRIPTCPCGSKNKIEMLRLEKRKQELKEAARRQKYEILLPSKFRYPRYDENRIRFPRL
jgi:hypothetical protein